MTDVWCECFLLQQRKLRLGSSYLSEATQLLGGCEQLNLLIQVPHPFRPIVPCRPPAGLTDLSVGSRRTKALGSSGIKDAEEELSISSRSC